ncbi:MAG TPA: transcription-repair coupling factor [Candidatus Eisenbacteria bacterium]|nr:transcription-repair coupling factor [Candidatus Eisenbacteria bacterium]
MSPVELPPESEGLHARLLGAVAGHPATPKLLDRARAEAALGAGVPRAGVRVRGTAGSVAAILASLLAKESGSPVAVITPDLDRAESWRDDLAAFLGPDRVVYLPPLDVVPWSHQTPTSPVRDERLDGLARLADAQPPVAVIPAAALHRLLPKPATLRGRAFTIARGWQGDPRDMLGRLVLLGYRPVSEVSESGEISRRGGIVDVHGPGMEEPVRLEFDGDEVASLRSFDPATQRSTGVLESVRIVPAREVLYADDLDQRLRPFAKPPLATGEEARRLRDLVSEGIYFEGAEWLAPHLGLELGSLLDHLPAGTLLWMEEPAAVERELEQVEREAERLEAAARERNPLLPPRDALFENPNVTADRLRGYPRFESTFSNKEIKESADVIAFDARPQPAFGRKLDLLRGELKRLGEVGYRRSIVCDNRGQADRLEELLGDDNAVIEVGALVGGFVLPAARIAVFTDHEIFARYRRRRGRRLRPSAAAMRELLTLAPGDYVVHLDHGIGAYRGLQRLQLDGQETECIQIDYAGGDRLFVPIDQLGLIERYAAEEGHAPTIHRLGGTTWARTKAKTKKAIADMAEELLRHYAARKAHPGHAYKSDTPWQRELESAFVYDETPDQLRAIEDVKRDMETSKPMDRLLCGDVGYGKTEVAIRAAFKAIQDGKQVAILVPTTVLAQQHGVTFTERLADYPVRIEVLSRFRNAKEQAEVVERLGRGEVDLIIGTHRLLSKDVRFSNLGLVVIDEEQRFGVKQKEKIRTLVQTVDVLTLTATPIPRTLHLSLLGARDMSVMTTPPRGRYPIKTEIVEMNREVIQDALLREADRGGQSFFVHNRVETIDQMAHYLQSIVPQLRYAVAHGQMKDTQLEKVMLDFLERRVDVLVSTLIIESGLDIPTVNTMLINRADALGLAQIYQLRGRIGRSHHQAFCYLLVPAGKVLSEDSEKRLRVIAEHEELGAGLQIAMRDLEIRGAGNLLGPQQHGFMTSVGFDLYCRMVDEVVQELKGTAVEHRPEPEVASDLPAFVPEEYVTDRDEKLDVYRRLAAIGEAEALDALAAELRDRFGAPPPEVEQLLALKRLRLLGRDAGAVRLRVRRERLELEFGEPLARPKALALVGANLAKLEFADSARILRVAKPGDPVLLATNILRRLGPLGSVSPLPSPAGAR